MGMLYKTGAYPEHVGSLRQEMQQALDDEAGLAETYIQQAAEAPQLHERDTDVK